MPLDLSRIGPRPDGALALWTSSWGLGLKWIVRGIEYTRCVEYPLALSLADLRPGMRILDVGAAPFSLLPLYLARRGAFVLVCLDIAAYVSRLRDNVRRIERGVTRTQFIRSDARRTGLRSESFDRIFAISTIEHISGDGDTHALKELARVLRKGGIAIITVPVATRHVDEFRDVAYLSAVTPDAHVRDFFPRQSGVRRFFQRRYDRASLESRLIVASDLVLEKRVFFGEPRVSIRSGWARRHPMVKVLTNWVAPILAACFLRPVQDIAKAEGVVLIFRKKSQH